jgi:hypothetical protein
VTNYFITDRETKKKKARKKTEEWEEWRMTARRNKEIKK